MKLTLGLVLLSLLTSCGKNAFLESKDGAGRIIRGVTPGDGTNDGPEDGVPNDPQVCNLKEVVIYSEYRDLNKADHPFEFSPGREGEYNRYVKDGKNKLTLVEFGMTILDFDLSSLNIKDHKIKNVHFNFNSDQYYLIEGSYKQHESQICHNQNYLCSGDENSVYGHVINNDYRWIDRDFSDYINGIETTEKYCKWALKEIRGGYDVTRMFLNGSDNFSTDELKSNYSIYVSDNHKITDASLKVSYCQ